MSTAEDNLARLRTAFVEGLGLAPDQPVDELVYNTIDAWDSVAHMQLVTAIEDAFDLMLDTDEIIDMSSFVEARRIVAGHDVELPPLPVELA